MKKLIKKISDHSVIVGIIGMGYVGLPLAIAFSEKSTVIGYDINSHTINLLNHGKSHILDVPESRIKKYLDISFFPTDDPSELKRCDFIIICVPTPLTEEKVPDLNFVKMATEMISNILSKDQFIILESTTYPGTTKEVVIPILEKSGLKAGLDFGIAYSPERIDPGNKQYTIDQVPKVVGGINPDCTEIAAFLYGDIINRIIPVRDMQTAESVKMMENIFRNVNIALVNEMALIFELMGINTWEVVEAAATKPYGFMPFYPGPGIGGHCIPLDPFYMSYKAKKFGFIPRFIETSAEINEFMKMHIVNLVERGLNQVNKSIYCAKVAVFGVTYKKNISDTRESPSKQVIEELLRLGAEIRIYDPYVSSYDIGEKTVISEKRIEDTLYNADCAVFLVDHDVFFTIDLIEITKIMSSPVIVDAKNIFSPLTGIIYLGLGKGSQK